MSAKRDKKERARKFHDELLAVCEKYGLAVEGTGDGLLAFRENTEWRRGELRSALNKYCEDVDRGTGLEF